jgi:hypothetical protein
MSVTLEAKVTRGPESWNFIYVMLGFTLTIEATVVTMIEPLKFPYNLVVYALVLLGTGWLFLDCGWFQNKLIGWKNTYEGKSR